MAAKPPKRITLNRLRNIGHAYVQRYGGSRARLQQVLTRRVDRSLRYHDELAKLPEATAWVQEVVEDLCTQGICDERRQARAEAIAQSLLGRPARMIRQRLRMKGFESATIDEALGALRPDADACNEAPDPDWVACCRFARRRGLGPFHRRPDRPRDPQRELGALMRAGFGYGYAKRVLEAESADELEQVIDGAALPRL